MENTESYPGSRGVSLHLLVTTVEPHPVSFTVTAAGQSTSHTVAPGLTVRVDLPPNSAYVTDVKQSDRSVLVQAEEGKTVSVYGVNDVHQSTDSFLALPCDGMTVGNFRNYQYAIFSTEYEAGRSSEYKRSELLIVTCEPGTRVVITPSQRLTVDFFVPVIQFGPGLRRDSATWTDENGFLPREGQTLLISSFNDLTGTIIRSDRPIVVYTGHKCAQSPTACGHIVEQVPPQTTWGYTYFLIPLSIRESGDYYRIMAVLDNTLVTITCVGEGDSSTEHTQFTLHKQQSHNWGEFYTHHRPCDSYTRFVHKFCSLQATNPVLVAHYSDSYSDDLSCTDQDNGDPFLSIVPPVVQYLNSYSISSVETSTGPSHMTYISVSVHHSFFEPLLIMVDDEPLEPSANAWQPLYCSDDNVCGYSVVRPLSRGHHRVYHRRNNAAIGLQVYGFQHHNSYGSPGGFGLEAIAGM